MIEYGWSAKIIEDSSVESGYLCVDTSSMCLFIYFKIKDYHEY